MFDLDESWVVDRCAPQVDLVAELRHFLIKHPSPGVIRPVAAWDRLYKLLPMATALSEGIPSDCLRLLLIDKLEHGAHARKVLTRTRSLPNLKCGAYASSTPVTS